MWVVASLVRSLIVLSPLMRRTSVDVLLKLMIPLQRLLMLRIVLQHHDDLAFSFRVAVLACKTLRQAEAAVDRLVARFDATTKYLLSQIRSIAVEVRPAAVELSVAVWNLAQQQLLVHIRRASGERLKGLCTQQQRQSSRGV